MTYAANGLNQYTGFADGTASYTTAHDARGNMTSDAARSYTYNARNQLIAANGGPLYYHYPTGLLGGIGPEGLVLDWSGAELVTEATTHIERRYVYGPGVDEPLVWYEGSDLSDPRYLVADERGSIVAVTDGAGAALSLNSYDEYGNPAATAPAYGGGSAIPARPGCRRWGCGTTRPGCIRPRSKLSWMLVMKSLVTSIGIILAVVAGIYVWRVAASFDRVTLYVTNPSGEGGAFAKRIAEASREAGLKAVIGRSADLSRDLYVVESSDFLLRMQAQNIIVDPTEKETRCLTLHGETVSSRFFVVSIESRLPGYRTRTIRLRDHIVHFLQKGGSSATTAPVFCP